MPLSSVSTSSMTSLSASSDGQRRSGSAKLPLTSIPDMRFEQSYLASVRAFIHEVEKQDAQQIKESRQDAKEERSSASRHENTSDDDPIVSDVLDAGVQSTTKRRRRTASQSSSPPHIMTSTSLQGEPELWLGRLRIEWLPLLYCTVRDQLLSPVIQGAIFGMGGLALGHVRTFLMARRQRIAARQP